MKQLKPQYVGMKYSKKGVTIPLEKLSDKQIKDLDLGKFFEDYKEPKSKIKKDIEQDDKLD